MPSSLTTSLETSLLFASDEPFALLSLKETEILNEARFASLKDAGLKAYIYLPLKGRNGEVYGAFSLGSTTNEEFGALEIEFVESVGELLALARERSRAEEAAEGREEEYRRLFEAPAIANVECDLTTTRFFRANQRYCDLVGYSREELLSGLTFADITHPDDLPRNLVAFKTLLSGEKDSFELEKRYIRKDGEVVWVHMTATLLRDARGKPVRICGSATDITERKTAEHALQTSAERLRLFIAHAPVAIAMFDREMRYLTVSQRWRRAYGLPEHELEGLSHYDVEPLAKRWQEVHKRGLLGEVVSKDEEEIIAPDGTSHFTKWEVHPWRDVDGTIGGIVIFTEDITQRKEAEARVALASSAGGIGYWSWNLRTNETEIDDLTAELFNISNTHPSAPDVLSRIHPEDRERVQKTISQAVEERQKYHTEFRALHDSGEIRWIAGRGDVVADENGEVTRLSGVNFDITRIKNWEEELTRREEEFRTLADNISQLAWMADNSGHVTWYNKRWFEYTGSSLDEMKGWGWTKVVDPQMLTDILSGWKESLRRGDAWEDTFLLRRYDGEMRWHLSRAIPIKDSKGAIVRWFGTNTDVTPQKRLEEELRASEGQLRAVTDIARVGLGIIDRSYSYRFANQAYLDILDGKEEDIVGRKVEEVLGDLYHKVLPCMAQASRGKRVSTELTISRGPEKTPHYYTATFEVYKDPHGESLLAMVLIDITTRLEAEQALRESEETLKAFYDASPALMGIIELTDEGDICHLYDNKASCHFFGLPPEGIRNKLAMADLGVDQSIVDFWRYRYLKSAEANEAVAFEYQVEEAPRPRWLSVTVVPLPERGISSRRFCYMAHDITSRKQGEEALKTRERELQTLADNSPDMLARFDRQGRYVFVNEAIRRAIGTGSEALLGKGLAELPLPSALCEELSAAVGEVIQHKEAREVEFECSYEGEKRSYSARLVPELDRDGQVSFVIGAATDQTARKSVEDTLRAADRRKDEFIATLAHELRNPLAPIRTGIQILQRAPDSPNGTKIISMMDRQLTHMVRLIDDLLDVSRISRGKIQLKLEQLHLQSIIQNTVEAARTTIEEEQHTLLVMLPNEPVFVKGDAVRISQIIGNLLHNASKYTPEGGRITLELTRERETAKLKDSDNGVGIAPEALPKVFDMFAQVVKTIERSQGGLGIGLALAKNLAELHGGRLSAESKGLGLGSSFALTLPLLLTVQDEERTSTPFDILPSPRLSNVLVVDDNQDAAESLAMLLKLWGFTIKVVHSGADALREVQHSVPDAIFLDIGMPEMNGYEVARRIKGELKLGKVKLIAVTGWGSENDVMAAAAAGFDLHLTKPVSSEEIEKTIAQLSSDFGSEDERP